MLPYTPTTKDRLWIDLARRVAEESKDRSTKVGAVIISPEDKTVLSTGWNGFPRGVNDDENYRHERPEKYIWTEHAERNAIYNAARLGIKLKGSHMYVSCYLPICCDCARAIVQSGIESVYRSNKKVKVNNDWSSPQSSIILIEGRVTEYVLDY